MEKGRDVFMQGYRHGIPIGLGYFAVAFSLGIAARDYGFSAVQGFISSLITYARYILMGFALNQRMPEGTPLSTRLLVGSCITDEIFGITIARPGAPTPYYTFGALIAAVPLWALGTACGISMGNILPARIVSALSVALFGMFIAVIIPPARKDKAVLGAVAVSFACSYAAVKLPYISDLSQGNRTILLTVVIAAVFAVLFPRKTEGSEGGAADED